MSIILKSNAKLRKEKDVRRSPAESRKSSCHKSSKESHGAEVQQKTTDASGTKLRFTGRKSCRNDHQASQRRSRDALGKPKSIEEASTKFHSRRIAKNAKQYLLEKTSTTLNAEAAEDVELNKVKLQRESTPIGRGQEEGYKYNPDLRQEESSPVGQKLQRSRRTQDTNQDDSPSSRSPDDVLSKSDGPTDITVTTRIGNGSFSESWNSKVNNIRSLRNINQRRTTDGRPRNPMEDVFKVIPFSPREGPTPSTSEPCHQTLQECRTQPVKEKCARCDHTDSCHNIQGIRSRQDYPANIAKKIDEQSESSIATRQG
ncbi:unnamed protein product [Caenorhabditis nigoni]